MSKYKIYYTIKELWMAEVEADSEEDAIRKFEDGSKTVVVTGFCEHLYEDEEIEEVVKVPEKFDLSIDKSHPV